MLTALPLAFTIAFATALVPGISAAKAKGDKKTIETRIKSSADIPMISSSYETYVVFRFSDIFTS